MPEDEDNENNRTTELCRIVNMEFTIPRNQVKLYKKMKGQDITTALTAGNIRLEETINRDLTIGGVSSRDGIYGYTRLEDELGNLAMFVRDRSYIEFLQYVYGSTPRKGKAAPKPLYNLWRLNFFNGKMMKEQAMTNWLIQ